MSETGIYEIMQNMRDGNVVKNDMNEMAQMVKNMLTEKYFGKIQGILSQKHSAALQNPSKEVCLLNAMRPFVPEHNHKNIDNIIDCLTMLEVFNGIRADFRTNSNTIYSGTELSGSGTICAQTTDGSISDTSIHEDGIYNIDSACMARKKLADGNGMLGAMLAMLMLLH